MHRTLAGNNRRQPRDVNKKLAGVPGREMLALRKKRRMIARSKWTSDYKAQRVWLKGKTEQFYQHLETDRAFPILPSYLDDTSWRCCFLLGGLCICFRHSRVHKRPRDGYVFLGVIQQGGCLLTITRMLVRSTIPGSFSSSWNRSGVTLWDLI